MNSILSRVMFVTAFCFGYFPVIVSADNSAPKTVIVYGDSITAGNMLPADQRDHVWLHVVEEKSQGQLHLVNEGKGGRPTASVPEFNAMLKRQGAPAILVIALGMNDSRDVTANCVPKAVANIGAMIGAARATWGQSLPILLLGPTNVNKAALVQTKPIADQRASKLQELNAAFEKLAGENSCSFFSLYGLIPDSTLLKDGVHPDVDGNEILGQALVTVLMKLTIASPSSPTP